MTLIYWHGLGQEESIEAVLRVAGLSREAFDAWWQRTTARSVPPNLGRVQTPVTKEVTIQRDELGIPHIFAENDADLFFGLVGPWLPNRLFQLDWLRRRGHGQLAEILGPRGVELDTTSRTVGLNRIAAAEWATLSPEVQATLESFTAGINAFMQQCPVEQLPVEFGLLGYRPTPWKPVDCLVIENEFRWYLTGRFPIICMPELAKRALGDGPLYQAYLQGECDEESILHPGDYPTADSGQVESVGEVVNDPDASTGSNNWVIAGSRTTSGHPLLGSDPHIAFEAVSCWYEVHLCGGSYQVAGMAYVGMPAILIGRNHRVAWGITNNICSQRDLFQEKTDAEHPDCFLYDQQWEPARELQETIHVRGQESMTKTIRFSRNGPIVDEILPPPADATGPVSLRWLGASQGGWLTALLDMNRSASVAAFREALRPWHVPLFNMVFADVEGKIGYQTAGRIPQRKLEERGYRPGWDPAYAWDGLIPFDELPRIDQPARGWIASANNRLAPQDFPRPLSGRWSSGWRARRIRQMIETREKVSTEDVRSMQQDCVSLRAENVAPALVELLQRNSAERSLAAVEQLSAWDFRASCDSVGAAIFNVFFTLWCQTVARERFDNAALPLMSKGVEGCATGLLVEDSHGWFAAGDHEAKIVDTFNEAIDELTRRCGPDLQAWKWGNIHRLPLRHVLSAVGDLGQLLDHGGQGVSGDLTTVCNTGPGPDWISVSGAGYRLIADLGSSPPALLAIDAQSQSGHPGSRHYSDQYEVWRAGNYHSITLDSAPDPSQDAVTLTGM